MINSNPAVGSLGNVELLAATREILRRGCVVEADLLVHLAEIEERRLHSEMVFPTMFAFCMDELGFSEAQAYNRTTVARAARRFPAMLDSLRSGAVHLTGLRLLALTQQNHRDLLAEAAGKSKRQIEEIVARLDPKPPVPDSFRKRPVAKQVALEMTSPGAAPLTPRREQRAVVAPLSEDTFTVQFTASRALRDKFRRAQDLLRHRFPSGEIAAIFDKALDSLIEKTGFLEFDHLDGFARTHLHDPERIVLRCRAHNQHEAEKLYGRELMAEARAKRSSPPAAQEPLFAP